MLPDWNVVGFTGHRELENSAAAAKAIAASLDRLEAGHGPLAAVSSIASGGDTLFVEDVARRKMPFFIVLPFGLDRFREDFSEEDWQRVLPYFERALGIEEIGPHQSPPEAYNEAGVVTVDRCDVLLALWNGKPANGVGGTGDIVAYARSIGKPLVLIDSVTGAITEERMNLLRGAREGAALEANPRAQVQGLFEAFDARANQVGPRARYLVLRAILWHLIAAAVALIPLTFHREGVENQVAIALEVVFLIAALIVGFRHHHAHHEWTHSRIRSELCRSFLAIWAHRRRDDPLRDLIPLGQECFYQSLHIAWCSDRGAETTLEEARGQYLGQRVRGQLKYFQDSRARAVSQSRILRAVASSSTIAAIVFGLVALAVTMTEHGAHGWEYSSAKLLSLLLPLLSAGVLSLVVAYDLGRRAVRYQELIDMLQLAAKRLEAAKTWLTLSRIVAETEQTLLDEVIEWHSVATFAGGSH